MLRREPIRRLITGEAVDRCGFWLGNPHADTWPILHRYFGTDSDHCRTSNSDTKGLHTMLRSLHSSTVLCVVLVLPAVFLPAETSHAATIAKDGKPAIAIVLAADAMPAEQTAAKELADYLEKVTGGMFTVIGESKVEKNVHGIYVGPTAYAKAHGLDPSGWRAERWAMRGTGRDLVLVGGRPRGTLYSVY